MKVIRGGGFSENDKQEKNLAGINFYPGNKVLYFGAFLKLAEPYLKKGASLEDISKLCSVVVGGWNMSVVKSIGVPGFNEVFKESMGIMHFSKAEVVLVKEIMKAKLEQFADMQELIQEYDIDEYKDGFKINLTTKDIFGMANMVEDEFDEESEFDEFDDDEDYDNDYYEDEGIVDRHALCITAKAPYWDWIRMKSKAFKEKNPFKKGIYLTPEFFVEGQNIEWLKGNFDKIFKIELLEYLDKEKQWPTKRTYEMFCDFFDFSFVEMVYDLESQRLYKD